MDAAAPQVLAVMGYTMQKSTPGSARCRRRRPPPRSLFIIIVYVEHTSMASCHRLYHQSRTQPPQPPRIRFRLLPPLRTANPLTGSSDPSIIFPAPSLPGREMQTRTGTAPRALVCHRHREKSGEISEAPYCSIYPPSLPFRSGLLSHPAGGLPPSPPPPCNGNTMRYDAMRCDAMRCHAMHDRHLTENSRQQVACACATHRIVLYIFSLLHPVADGYLRSAMQRGGELQLHVTVLYRGIEGTL